MWFQFIGEDADITRCVAEVQGNSGAVRIHAQLLGRIAREHHAIILRSALASGDCRGNAHRWNEPE